MSTRAGTIEVIYCPAWEKVFAVAIGMLSARVARTTLRDYSMAGRIPEDGPPREQLIAALLREMLAGHLVGRPPPFKAGNAAWLAQEGITVRAFEMGGLAFAQAWYRVSGEWVGIQSEKPPGKVRPVRRYGVVDTANGKPNVHAIDADMLAAAQALAARPDR